MIPVTIAPSSSGRSSKNANNQQVPRELAGEKGYDRVGRA
ncbi:hypothetical protein Rrhod_2288 [Rhodococcus rhodnii LMG 5362]|uniref:Uncharacterized protein n=1 Tax=Rhodococcus rhodnii LMG 5362 TaxID=1273125 RepID=R7WM29_9NOCA|nr:hypothetical protein Rrhod_2288 [Rhodococcus rhodnii LMG 5362]